MLSPVEISVRLKAARWLHASSDKPKPKPMPVEDVAALPTLRANRITKNRLQEIEQLKTEPRQMELEKIAEALDLPAEWFTEPDWRLLLAGNSLPGQELEQDLADAARRSGSIAEHSGEQGRVSRNR